MFRDICLIFLFTNALGFTIPEADDSVVYIGDNRIIGGKEAEQHAYPFMARLTTLFKMGLLSGSAMCGGSLINNQWVMSAGHCVYNIQDGSKWSEVHVFLADHFSNVIEQGELQIKAENVFIHPNYISKGENDISLIKLSQTVEFSANLQRGCLAPVGTEYIGQTATAIGWGLTSTSRFAGVSPVLKEAQLPIVEDAKCSRGPFIPKNMICTGFMKTVGEDTVFKGDSGGPLFVRDEEQKPVIVGVASYVTLQGLLRQKVTSAVFTKVATHVEWIQEHTNDLCLG